MYKERKFLVDAKDVLETVRVIQRFRWIPSAEVGNCGWAKAPDCWFVYFRCTDKTYAKILAAIYNKGIKLLSDLVGR